MTRSRTRLLAASATALSLIVGGFEAHLAPQTGGWWHGLTGSPSALRIVLALLAGLFVYGLGRRHNVAAFVGMALGLLPLVPALSGFGSGLLFFSAFSMVLIAGILMGAASPQIIHRLRSPRPLTATLGAFAFFLLVGRFLPGPAGPQGDEPHYLLIAESLLQDRDVDLKNQFEERAFSKFTISNLEPHTAPRSPQGRLYAIHTPGLAALVAPGYALSGYAGARAVVSGVLAVVVGLLCFATTSMFGSATGAFVFLLATCASPLPIYANSLYPDSVATLPVAATLAYLISGRTSLLVLSCVSMAALPWLHPRFLPLALLLAIGPALRGHFSWGRAAFAFGPILVSLGLLLWHFHSLFGSASLSAAYGPGFASDVSLARIPWGGTALIFDRQFGLLLFAPVLLLGLAGFRVLWMRNRVLTLLAAAVLVVQVGVGGSFSMWWGGASAPARFLIAALPVLLFVSGAAWSRDPSDRDRRSLMGSGAGFGAGLLFLACLAPRALHNRSDGESGLLRLLSPVLDLDRFFPSFVDEASVWLALLWGVILAALWIRPRVGAAATCIFVLIASLAAPTPLLSPFSSGLRLLEAWSDSRRSFGGVDSESAFSLNLPLGDSPWMLSAGTMAYSPRFSLPKGEWTLSVESQSEAGPNVLNAARVSLRGPNDHAFASASIRIGESVATSAFVLDSHQQRLNAWGEGFQGQATILSIRLEPKTLAP